MEVLFENDDVLVLTKVGKQRFPADVRASLQEVLDNCKDTDDTEEDFSIITVFGTKHKLIRPSRDRPYLCSELLGGEITLYDDGHCSFDASYGDLELSLSCDFLYELAEDIENSINSTLDAINTHCFLEKNNA